MQKKQGISLIVLVITIIVMIILAAAIILSLNNAGIIGNANKAVQETNVANVKAAADLLYADYLIAGTATGLSDEELGTKLTDDLKANGTITGEDYYIKVYDGEASVITVGSVADKFYKGEIKIGDYIQYDPTAGVENASTVSYTSNKTKNGYANQVFTLEGSYTTYGWQVMGVGKGGELLLLSEDFIQPTSGGYAYNDRNFFGLSGKVDGEINKSREVYLSAVGELNNICSIFGNGYGATGARCITIEDIDTITGYKPDEMIFRDGEIGEYKNTVTFYWKNDNGTIKVWYECSNGAESNYLTETHAAFEWFDGSTYHKETAPTTEELAVGEKQKITTLKNDYYLYYPETLTRLNTDTQVGTVKSGTLEYDLLFTDARAVNTNCYYWLASPYVFASSAYASFGVRLVYPGRTSGFGLFRSHGAEGAPYRGVRAVVSLASDISLVKTEETVTVGTNTANVYSIAK